ncbi:PqqD family protein [Treponema sp.]|uniref:PqqD family protein n=1 Tax=Treponema sp. TaxID=166 RepID=UPI0025CDEB34|nr:PqqD family protein [Treponema sp.]MCR5217425.1 PqqD family protein [Treponema sp.]
MKKQSNFLDLVFEKNEKFRSETDSQGGVTIFVENKGFFNRIMQRFFGKPVFSQVHLEEFGSFIWPLIDGSRNVQELGLKVKEHFGERAEPLYPRLVQYMKMLLSYNFIKKV